MDNDPGPSPVFLALMAPESVNDLIIAVSLVLVVLAAAAGTAVRNVRWSRLEKHPRAKDRLPEIEARLKDERRLLDSLQIVRVLASVALILALVARRHPGAGSGPGDILLDAALGAAVILLIPFGIVRGAVRMRPEATLLALLPVARALEWAAYPVWVVVDGIARIFSRALGLEPQASEGEEEVREEILDVVSEGEREGAIADGEREMIESIIEFRDRAVSEVMTPRIAVTGVPVEAGLDELVRVVVDQGHSRLPVYQETIDNIVGVVHAKDLLAHWSRRGEDSLRIADLMRKPIFVPETKNISDLLAQLRREKVHMAIVLDEYGGTAGLVTVEDIVEEIVGEIQDEHDPDSPEKDEVKKLSDHEAEVSARVHIDELNEAMDLTIPEDDGYDTLGGFLFARLGRVPSAGETWDYEKVKFEILDADERRINRVKVVVGE